MCVCVFGKSGSHVQLRQERQGVREWIIWVCTYTNIHIHTFAHTDKGIFQNLVCVCVCADDYDD